MISQLFDKYVVGSIGRINTLFTLFQHIKKEINGDFQLRDLTDIRQHTLNCSFQATDPVDFQLPGMSATCRYFCVQQFGELTGSN
jgi:hypothetical protein